MLDVFSPLTPDRQRETHAAYRQFLMERDGAPDIENRVLPRREAGMARYMRPLARLRDIDRAVFHQQHSDFSLKRQTSPETALLLALVKANSAEAYGVSQTFDMVARRAVAAQDDVELLLLIEETYHTRILLSSTILYGLSITAPFKPPLALQGLIASIAVVPAAMSRPLTMAGEIIGAVTFLNLLDSARDILKHDPELRDAVEERLIEVLTDELGHISFSRMLMGRAGLMQARVFLPWVARTLSIAMPELRALGLRASAEGGAMVTTSPRLPEAVRKAAFVA